jgi:histidinol dehydrogenase
MLRGNLIGNLNCLSYVFGSILLCPDADFIAQVEASIAKLLPTMTRKTIIAKALKERGALIHTIHGNPIRVGFAITNNQYLARPSNHINANLSKYCAFSSCHIGITRADDFIDLWHRFSTMSKKTAFDNLDNKEKTALQVAADRVRTYHEKQKQTTWTYKEDNGTMLGQKITPIERVSKF